MGKTRNLSWSIKFREECFFSKKCYRNFSKVLTLLRRLNFALITILEEEIETAWRKTFKKMCSKQWFICARKPPKKMYRFLLHWTKTIQHGTIKGKRCKDNRWLQKQTKRMDMGIHLLIFWLVSSYLLKLTKKHLQRIIFIYFIAVWILDLVFIVLMDK